MGRKRAMPGHTHDMRTGEYAEVDVEIFGKTTVSFANSPSSGIWAHVWRRRMSLG